jgi:hypothetical protein
MHVETTAKVILDAAPVAHFFQTFALLEQFEIWLTKQASDAHGLPEEIVEAILVVERLRVRSPGRCPWTREVLLRIMETRLILSGGAGASAAGASAAGASAAGAPGDESLGAYDCDMWMALKPETQVMLLDVARFGRGASLSDSEIITPSDTHFFHQLRAWLAESGFELTSAPALYRASRDGFEAATFHRLCDSKGGTLTIIRSGPHIFGGFLDISWQSDARGGRFARSDNTFLFALRGPNTSTPTKIVLNAEEAANAGFFHPDYGPTFGSGHDLYVGSLANTTEVSESGLGRSYVHPMDDRCFYFTGTANFYVTELEVFPVRSRG